MKISSGETKESSNQNKLESMQRNHGNRQKAARIPALQSNRIQQPSAAQKQKKHAVLQKQSPQLHPHA
jgi:hypothetical protein